MIQTPAFRNINIFFLIQTYGSYIYTVQKIILRPAGPRFITAMTGGGRWLQEGTQGEERGGQRGTLFFFFPLSFSWGGGYTHILREVEGLYIVFFQIPSIPLRPQYTAPRVFHSVAFSLDHHHARAHTFNYTLFSLSLFLPFIHAHSFRRSFLLTLSYSSDIFSFFFFFSFLVIYTRAFMFVVFSYSATFKYRIFRNN